PRSPVPWDRRISSCPSSQDVAKMVLSAYVSRTFSAETGRGALKVPKSRPCKHFQLDTPCGIRTYNHLCKMLKAWARTSWKLCFLSRDKPTGHPQGHPRCAKQSFAPVRSQADNILQRWQEDVGW